MERPPEPGSRQGKHLDTPHADRHLGVGENVADECACLGCCECQCERWIRPTACSCRRDALRPSRQAIASQAERCDDLYIGGRARHRRLTRASGRLEAPVQHRVPSQRSPREAALPTSETFPRPAGVGSATELAVCVRLAPGKTTKARAQSPSGGRSGGSSGNASWIQGKWGPASEILRHSRAAGRGASIVVMWKAVT
jgi:hypothetical protein